MASKNSIAFAEGRITKDQFDSMAAYKFDAYGNDEDLDIDEDYTKYGIYKIGFEIGVYTERYITSPEGLFKAIMKNKAKTGEYYYDCDPGDDYMRIKSYYWRWASDTSRTYINGLMIEEGLDPSNWDWYEAD